MLAVMLIAATTTWAQKLPERRHIRQGNEHYAEKSYDKAMDGYLEALKLDSLSVEGAFNMGDVQYTGGEYEAAEQTFAKLAESKAPMSDEQRAKIFYNLGNAQFQQQKLQEALESYKESLRLKPEDPQTKFNYLHTKEKLSEGGDSENQQNQNQDQNQQGDQSQQGDNQQEQQEQNNNQNNNQQNNQQNNQPEQNEEQNQNDNQPEEPQGEKPEPSGGDQQRSRQEQPAPSKMSEQILDAVQHTEDQTREKVEEKQVVGVGASGKNW